MSVTHDERAGILVAQPEVLGPPARLLHSARLDHPNDRRPIERDLVESVAAGDDDGSRICGWRAKTWASKTRVSVIGHADKLVRRAGRIAERADQVEDRPKR